ncbi:copper resistance system multicopper oxidase [Leucothrix pacifica]|uniref:Copper resistance system multicopper oxidase n=1 Tax=Leucothrix pacifica TaxID=1247513 RepID=A0A317C679_9GAMM|nr:copper resistance system multicopper oxidase [Leucothrix pacifica]PWQ92903.1 copper resistance system multicopper oxidase [Leucothrix pacifica]
MNKLFKNSTGVTDVARRQFVKGLGMTGLVAGLAPSELFAAPTVMDAPMLKGNTFDLTLTETPVNLTGQRRMATTINGSLPGPTLRMKEGERITIRVTNKMRVTSSIHWHGLILPSNMDGVPGLSFAGIKPGETFTYQFDAVQSGTYWYHSHSGFQEATGLYGSIIIDPREKDVVQYDRDHIILLSDWSDESPEQIYAKLKKLSHYYNTRERVLSDFTKEAAAKGFEKAVEGRKMWNEMRMSDRDISDVTGRTYSFLTNGKTPRDGWEGMFKPGERVRLRFINGSAMTFFDVRIPGLKMEVVSSDGQDLRPVKGIDEFRIGVAETYDVIVEPKAGAYTIFSQAIDRSGYARGTLTSVANQRATVPALDEMPTLTMTDMGMDHGDMAGMKGMDHSNMAGMEGMDHSNMKPAESGVKIKMGPQVDMVATNPQVRLDDPGVGLRNNGRRVLTYGDLRNYYPTEDKRPPSREIELHMTGNMSRYMWSFNGVAYNDAKPIGLRYGERVRITLINDTMMNHPVHLHGMWSELESGDDNYLPRKHTIVVQPGAKISYLVTADAKGQWAYHCHLLFHMKGMFRRVIVA